MTAYEIYVFILCLVVYVMLVGISIFCITVFMNMALRIIRAGLEDPYIIDEYKRNKLKYKLNKVIRFFDYVFSIATCLVLVTVFLSSLFVEDASTALSFLSDDEVTYRVVQTGSMEEKHKKNRYLFDNDLNDQIQTFDVIRTEKLPDEMELELYDIVVYEVNDVLIVHRIIGIEEPNDFHPDCRHFVLQGDANEYADRSPVLYEQMRAIYTGVRFPFVGSFVLFMQSPAGWLCILLILVAIVATPLLESKLMEAKNERLYLYLDSLDDDEYEDEDE